MMNKILLFSSLLLILFSINSYALKYQIEDEIQDAAIQDNFRICEKDSDCISVSTHCGDCCIYDAINQKHEEAYYKLFNESCKGFHGPYCDCVVQGTEQITCNEGKCLYKMTPFE